MSFQSINFPSEQGVGLLKGGFTCLCFQSINFPSEQGGKWAFELTQLEGQLEASFQSINFPSEQGVEFLLQLGLSTYSFQSINFPSEQGDKLAYFNLVLI